MFCALITCARAGGNNFSRVSHQLGRELGKRDLPSPALVLLDCTSSVIQGENRTVRIDLGAFGEDEVTVFGSLHRANREILGEISSFSFVYIQYKAQM